MRVAPGHVTDLPSVRPPVPLDYAPGSPRPPAWRELLRLLLMLVGFVIMEACLLGVFVLIVYLTA